jgi:hypothetical protein
VDTYDHWKLASDPQLGEEPVEEELEEPLVREEWDSHRGEFIHVVVFQSGSEFAVRRTLGGAYCNDYEIVGKNFYSDGHQSPEQAIAFLSDPERRDW